MGSATRQRAELALRASLNQVSNAPPVPQTWGQVMAALVAGFEIPKSEHPISLVYLWCTYAGSHDSIAYGLHKRADILNLKEVIECQEQA